VPDPESVIKMSSFRLCGRPVRVAIQPERAAGK